LCKNLQKFSHNNNNKRKLMQDSQTTPTLKAISEQASWCKNLQELEETFKWKAQQQWCKASPHSLQWTRLYIYHFLNLKPHICIVKYKIYLNKLKQELVGTCRNPQMKSLTMVAQSSAPFFATSETLYLSSPKPWICTMKIHFQNPQTLCFLTCISRNWFCQIWIHIYILLRGSFADYA
jgi:hypothetical protein